MTSNMMAFTSIRLNLQLSFVGVTSIETSKETNPYLNKRQREASQYEVSEHSDGQCGRHYHIRGILICQR